MAPVRQAKQSILSAKDDIEEQKEANYVPSSPRQKNLYFSFQNLQRSKIEPDMAGPARRQMEKYLTEQKLMITQKMLPALGKSQKD